MEGAGGPWLLSFASWPGAGSFLGLLSQETSIWAEDKVKEMLCLTGVQPFWGPWDKEPAGTKPCVTLIL